MKVFVTKEVDIRSAVLLSALKDVTEWTKMIKIAKSLMMTKDEARESIGVLERLRLIDTDRKTFIRVREQRVKELKGDISVCARPYNIKDDRGTLRPLQGLGTPGRQDVTRLSTRPIVKKGFFSITNKSIDQNDLEVYQRLRDILTRHRRVTCHPSKKKWMLDISKHRRGTKYHGPITQDQFMSCLDWLEKNIKSKYCPLVFSATSFCHKLPQLLTLVESNYRGTIDTSIPLSDAAASISKRLSHLRWPKEVQLVIPHSIDRQLKQMRDYVTHLHTLKSEPGINHLIKALGTPARFIEQWMVDEWNRVSGWKEWNGSITSIEFSPKSKKFRGIVTQHLTEYGLSQKKIQTIMEKL